MIALTLVPSPAVSATPHSQHVRVRFVVALSSLFEFASAVVELAVVVDKSSTLNGIVEASFSHGFCAGTKVPSRRLRRQLTLSKIRKKPKPKRKQKPKQITKPKPNQKKKNQKKKKQTNKQTNKTKQRQN
jgi:hypothetical protein